MESDGEALLRETGTRSKLSLACSFIMLIEEPLSPVTMNN